MSYKQNSANASSECHKNTPPTCHCTPATHRYSKKTPRKGVEGGKGNTQLHSNPATQTKPRARQGRMGLSQAFLYRSPNGIVFSFLVLSYKQTHDMEQCRTPLNGPVHPFHFLQPVIYQAELLGTRMHLAAGVHGLMVVKGMNFSGAWKRCTSW